MDQRRCSHPWGQIVADAAVMRARDDYIVAGDYRGETSVTIFAGQYITIFC